MKNTGQIILSVIVLAGALAYIDYTKSRKSNFRGWIWGKKKKKAEEHGVKRKCWRVNEHGNGWEWYWCSSAAV